MDEEGKVEVGKSSRRYRVWTLCSFAQDDTASDTFVQKITAKEGRGGIIRTSLG